MSLRPRMACPACNRDVAVSYGGRLHPHKTGRNIGDRCVGSGYLVGPSVVPSVECPTCKGAGVIRPGALRP